MRTRHQPTSPHPLASTIASTTLLLVLLGLSTTAASAQTEVPAAPPSGLEVTTAYPAVAVQAGDSVTFDLTVRAPQRQVVSLAVEGVPEGWTADLSGGGLRVDAVTADPEAPPGLTLDVSVPAEAEDGVQTLTVTADGEGGTSASLELDVRVSEVTGGEATLTTDFPILQGPSDATFAFDLTLANDTPAEETFALSASGPPGWAITVTPTGEAQATTSTVAGNATGTIRAEVDPPDDADAGTYEVVVRATGGGTTAETPLTVELTGNPELALTTIDERLNAEVSVGESTQVVLLLTNNGTAPAEDITMTSTPPAGWEVTFEPEAVASLAPGQPAEVVATITPAADGVAGDYLVTMRANAPEAGSSQVDIRTEVGRSSAAGIVGIGLIAVALLALVGVFRGLGRR